MISISDIAKLWDFFRGINKKSEGEKLAEAYKNQLDKSEARELAKDKEIEKLRRRIKKLEGLQ